MHNRGGWTLLLGWTILLSDLFIRKIMIFEFNKKNQYNKLEKIEKNIYNVGMYNKNCSL